MRKGRSNFLYSNSFPGGFLSEDCRDTVVFSKSIDFLVTGSIQNWWLEFFTDVLQEVEQNFVICLVFQRSSRFGFKIDKILQGIDFDSKSISSLVKSQDFKILSR